jgi:uncharacterized protein (TIGR02466 family)
MLIHHKSLGINMNSSLNEQLGALFTLYKQGRFEDVITQGNTLIEAFSSEARLINILGASNIALKRFDVAIEHYLKAIQLNPDNAEAHNNLGVAYKENGDLTAAIESYQKAISLKPDYAEAYNNLGSVLQEKGDHKAAIETYQRVIELTPSIAQVHSNLGAAYKENGDLTAAIESYQEAISIDPDYAEAHNNLGIAQKIEGYLEEAIESLTRALQLKPNDATIYVNLGATLQDKGDTDKAIEAYRQAIQIKPDLAEAQLNLGSLLLANKNFEEAIVHLKRATHISPHLSEAFEMIGNLHFMHQEYSKALVKYDLANSKRSRARALLCLYALGKYKEFSKRIEKSHDLDKGNIEMASVSAFVSNQINKSNFHPFCKNPLDFLYFSNIKNHKNNTKAFIDRLIDELEQIPSIWSPKKQATKNGFHTTVNLFNKNQGTISILEKIIRDEIKIYYEKFKSNECVFIDMWPTNISLNGWSIRIHQDGFQSTHIHPAGWLSGVIYLALVESEDRNEGAIEFSLHGYDYPIKNENFPKLRYFPQKGDIVFFPSSLFHHTIPIKNNGERIIVSFDLLPK